MERTKYADAPRRINPRREGRGGGGPRGSSVPIRSPIASQLCPARSSVVSMKVSRKARRGRKRRPRPHGDHHNVGATQDPLSGRGGLPTDGCGSPRWRVSVHPWRNRRYDCFSLRDENPSQRQGNSALAKARARTAGTQRAMQAGPEGPIRQPSQNAPRPDSTTQYWEPSRFEMILSFYSKCVRKSALTSSNTGKYQ
jgi:hypothetical protein